MDMSTVKCRDMAANTAEKNAMILMWLQGYYSEEDASPIVDFDKMKKDAGKLGAYCAKNPDHSVITAAEEALDDDAAGLLFAAIFEPLVDAGPLVPSHAFVRTIAADTKIS